MAQDAPPPSTIGRYRIVRRLGTGGMAEVFLARSAGAEGIEKLLVLKRILPHFASSQRFVSMFVDEAKVAMRLNHPNLVQMYAFEQVRDEFLLAMEFVDGLDLSRLLALLRKKNERLPFPVAAFIAHEAARGLDYAHNRKDESGQPLEIVHRDVSPQNILLSYDGSVKVADFGIARARLVSEETGVIKGKFSYMSPEQARGLSVDRRSDVFSLGVVFAELLMNQPMYPGLSGMAVLEQVREGKISSPGDIDFSVPKELDEIARKALTMSKDARYASCREFASALSKWLHQQEDLVDGTTIEHLLEEVSPRALNPESPRAFLKPGATIATYLSPQSGRDLRERRNVVVVSGNVRRQEKPQRLDADKPDSKEQGVGNDLPPRVYEQVGQIFSDIAFKYDASFEWRPDEPSAFRFVLGLSRVSVDDPLHAVRLALDVQDALSAVSSDLLSEESADLDGDSSITNLLALSLGLSRGAVMRGRGDGAEGRIRAEPLGLVFDVAEALSKSATSGEILVSGEVFRIARRAYSFDEREERNVIVGKGNSSDLATGRDDARVLRAYRYRGVPSREERAREAERITRQIGLIGRVNEATSLTGIYEDVLQSTKSSSIALVGEVGVGKSALALATISRWQPMPTILRVECGIAAQEVPYAAISELIRVAADVSDHALSENVREALRKLVKRTVPKSERRAAVLDVLESLLIPELHSEQAGDRSLELGQAVRSVLAGLSEENPVVMLVDAAQFIDAPSLSLLARMIAEPVNRRLLILVGTRPEERVLSVLEGVPRIHLGELDEAQSKELIRAHFGGAQVAPDVENAILERAGGNPYFLVELVDALRERGVLTIEDSGTQRRVVKRPGSSFVLPTTVEDVIAARLAVLPSDERIALRWAAVAGEGIRAIDLQDLAGRDLMHAIKQLEIRGLLKNDIELIFPSAVVRHVAYESIDAQDRVRMHKRLGTYLSHQEVPTPPARVANHHELAGDYDAAALAWREAGKAALAVYSNRDALRFFKRSLSLLPSDSPDRFELHVQREQILRLLSMRGEQRLELEALRDFAERSGLPKHVATAFNRLARYELDAGRPQVVQPMLSRALDAAIVSGDLPSEIESLRILALLKRDIGDVRSAMETLDKAEARTEGHAKYLALRGHILVHKALLSLRQGQIERALDWASESAMIFKRLGNKGLEAFAVHTLGLAFEADGSYEDSLLCVRASVLLDREAGDRLHLGRKMGSLARIYDAFGFATQAMEHLNHGRSIVDSMEDPLGRAHVLSTFALIISEREHERARTLLDDVRHTMRACPELSEQAYERSVRSYLLLQMKDWIGTDLVAKDALVLSRRSSNFAYELLALACAARANAELGKNDEAEILIRRALEKLSDDQHAFTWIRATSELRRAASKCGNAMLEAEVAALETRRTVEKLERIHDLDGRASFLSSQDARGVNMPDSYRAKFLAATVSP